MRWPTMMASRACAELMLLRKRLDAGTRMRGGPENRVIWWAASGAVAPAASWERARAAGIVMVHEQWG